MPYKKHRAVKPQGTDGRPLANMRHEAIANALVEYRADLKKVSELFGYRTVNSLRNLLYVRPEIRARVAGLQERRANVVAMKDVVTREEVVQSLRETRNLALGRGDLSAKNKADELLGRHIGMFTDKVLTRDSEIEGKTPEELEAFVAQAIAELGPNTVRRIMGSAQAEKHGGAAPAGEAAVSSQAEQARPLPAVSEAGDLPPRRLN